MDQNGFDLVNVTVRLAMFIRIVSNVGLRKNKNQILIVKVCNKVSLIYILHPHFIQSNVHNVKQNIDLYFQELHILLKLCYLAINWLKSALHFVPLAVLFTELIQVVKYFLLIFKFKNLSQSLSFIPGMSSNVWLLKMLISLAMSNVERLSHIEKS